MPTMERGMTLLEVLLAVLVVASTMFAAAAVQLQALQATDSARREGQAALLLHTQREQARAAGHWQVQP
ncbi:prepilin-type N-terminal cleavage/methylation domain-containing protein [Pseudomonas putida]